MTMAKLPIIDVFSLQSELEESDLDLQRLCNQVKEAFQQWGAFHIVNHGVEEELVNSVDSVPRYMFKLPPQVKERAVYVPSIEDGYFITSGLSLGEIMSFPPVTTSNSLQQYAQKLWPQGNPKFCDSLITFSSKLADLENSLIKLILQGLSLEKYLNIDFVGCEAFLNLNYISESEKSKDATNIILKEHIDWSLITILYNDQVGGLEMCSTKGEWFRVKPLASSFTIFMGDALKIWSNDRFWSVKNHATYEGRKPQLLVTLFWDFPQEKEVLVPEELIDDHHPCHYKSFIFKDYVKDRLEGAPLNIFL